MPPFAPEDERERALLEQHAKLEREFDGLRNRTDDGAAERRANLEAAMSRIRFVCLPLSDPARAQCGHLPGSGRVALFRPISRP
jgi:hypothetical protein